MQTLTEIVAAVVVQSSAFAYSHFGVALEAPRPAEPPSHAERTVARTAFPRPAVKVIDRARKTADCPTQKAEVFKT